MSEEDRPRLRLGLQGWPHPEWINGYFPEDLPEDWRFNYYANDAACLLLSEEHLTQIDSGEIEEWLDDAPEHFRFYLTSAKNTVLSNNPLSTVIQQTAENYWRTTDTQQIIAILPYTNNLRDLRKQLEQLPDNLEAIVFTGDANPQQLHEIRTLTELLGIA